MAYSFELLNTGAANTHKLMGNSGPSGQHVKATSAAQYLGTNTAATGLSFVANNSMGFVNLGVYEMAGNDLVTGANNLNLTYLRVAGTLDVAGWDVGFGLQNFGGKSTVTMTGATKATIVDGQAQGEVAGNACRLVCILWYCRSNYRRCDNCEPIQRQCRDKVVVQRSR